MSIYNLLYIINLSAAGVLSFYMGSAHERSIWFGLLAYWVLVWAFASSNPMVIGINMVVSMIFATALLYLGESIYDKILVAVFTIIVLLSALAGLGILSVERGQGAFAHTYWNYRTWLLHLACFILMGSCYARRLAI